MLQSGKHEAKRQTEGRITVWDIRNLLLSVIALAVVVMVIGANQPTPNAITGLPPAQARELPSVTPTGIAPKTTSPTTPSILIPKSWNGSETTSEPIGHFPTMNEPPSINETSQELPNLKQPTKQQITTSTDVVTVTQTTLAQILSGTTTTPKVVSSTTQTTMAQTTTQTTVQPTTTTLPSTTTTTTVVPTSTTCKKKHKDC